MQAGRTNASPFVIELGGDPEMRDLRAWGGGDEGESATELELELDVSRTLPFPSSRFEMRHWLWRTNRARVVHARLLVLIQGPRDNDVLPVTKQKRKAWLGWPAEVSQSVRLARQRAKHTQLFVTMPCPAQPSPGHLAAGRDQHRNGDHTGHTPDRFYTGYSTQRSATASRGWLSPQTDRIHMHQ